MNPNSHGDPVRHEVDGSLRQRLRAAINFGDHRWQHDTARPDKMTCYLDAIVETLSADPSAVTTLDRITKWAERQPQIALADPTPATHRAVGYRNAQFDVQQMLRDVSR